MSLLLYLLAVKAKSVTSTYDLSAGGDGYNIRGFYTYDMSLGNTISHTRYYVAKNLLPRSMTSANGWNYAGQNICMRQLDRKPRTHTINQQWSYADDNININYTFVTSTTKR